MSAAEPTERARVFTVGHSIHGLDEFLRLLRTYRVEQLADVRRYPGSRRLPWFNREVLARELDAGGLLYLHLPSLGGRRRPSPESPNSGWRVEAFRGYADHMASPEFKGGLARLEELASGRLTAMMCAEALWWRCHRRLVSDALTVRGWEVLHIGPRGEVTVHELSPFAVEDAGCVTYPPVQTSLGGG
jgi:uncharacterized protein (DUF488 family)